MPADVSDLNFQQTHYDELIRTKRATKYGLSCGYHDRFDPKLLERRPALRRALKELFEKVLPPSFETMLDLACGTAYYWPLLENRCNHLVGIDLSKAMAQEGSEYYKERKIDNFQYDMFCSEASDLPFADRSFDLVLALDAIHHLSNLDHSIGEVRRVLRKGGRFVVIEPNVFNPVVFAAHLVPPEERMALYPNHPWAVSKALHRAFDQVEIFPVTYVSGINNRKALRFVELVSPIFERKPLSYVALRRVFVARNISCP